MCTLSCTYTTSTQSSNFALINQVTVITTLGCFDDTFLLLDSHPSATAPGDGQGIVC